jgi:putative redox protein
MVIALSMAEPGGYQSQRPHMPNPEQVVLDLEWLGDSRIRGRSGAHEMVMDSPPAAGPSPVQTLAFALAGCMAMDVLALLRRSRFALTGLTAHLVADRAPSDPKRVVKVDLRFTLAGQVPEDRVARAIQLSREKYCSVWHSMRPDIELATSFEIVSGPAPASAAGVRS